MKLGRLLGAVVLGILAATPAFAQTVVDGSKVDNIVTIARGYGSATLERPGRRQPAHCRQHQGHPLLRVLHELCDGRRLRGHQLLRRLRQHQADDGCAQLLETRDKRFGNAYLDADLDAAIEYDVNLEYGVTRENLDAAFGVWSVLLEQYTEYVGYKPAP